jgi:hypothetical protein
MDDPLLPQVSDQLKLATDVIRSAVEVHTGTVSREHIALGLERLLLVQELISSISDEFVRLESENKEYRNKISTALPPSVQKLEKATEPHKASGPEPKSARNILPDQGLIDGYTDIAIKYGNLRREMAIMRTNIESACRRTRTRQRKGDKSKFRDRKLKRTDWCFRSRRGDPRYFPAP